ncbi:MAG: FG-GAP repeat protein [Kiritimatiellales bacterium]|nr:FG-GAP repeat protein [Kiritimatiellota bacterium]MBL7012268.1 FG-GAP repeat protein [Kiritimatiellales bacterium]
MKRIITFCITSFIGLGLANAGVVETQKLLAIDGAAEDSFGSRVAISGDYAIVGSYNDDDSGYNSGSAYIFERINGIWTNVTKLTASDGAAYDEFGIHASIAGNYVIVGARNDGDNGYRSGSAYIFERIAGTWTEVAKLTASDGEAWDWFGTCVAISGDHAIVGAEGDDDHGSQSGSAYIYERIDGVWTNVTKLTASDGGDLDAFGYSVSISGDHVIVGARDDDDTGLDSGSVYIFERIAGTWTEVTKLTASDGAAGDSFSFSSATWGDYAIVGSPNHGNHTGAAYLFERSDGTWSEVAKLTASDGVADDSFGLTVSISDDYAIVGSYNDDDNGYNSGSAYLFERVAGTWIEVAKLTASDGAAGDQFGTHAAISGENVVVGARYDEDNGYKSGSAYMFELLPVADAGGPYVENAISWVGGRVTLDGLDSYDPDGGALTYEWDLNLAWDSDSDGNPSNDVDETSGTAVYLFDIGQTDIALVVRNETGLASEPDITSVTVSFMEVEIDIKPGSDINSINMGSHGVIPVAFLTDETFDASTIDPLTVTLRGEDFSDGLVELRGKKDVKPMASLVDVDDDSDLDLLVKLDTEKLSEYEVEAECTLGALTYDGYVVSGSDTIHVVPEE